MKAKLKTHFAPREFSLGETRGKQPVPTVFQWRSTGGLPQMGRPLSGHSQMSDNGFTHAVKTLDAATAWPKISGVLGKAEIG